jgi:hypothetical protein
VRGEERSELEVELTALDFPLARWEEEDGSEEGVKGGGSSSMVEMVEAGAELGSISRVAVEEEDDGSLRGREDVGR